MQYPAFFSYCKILVIFRTYLLISIFLLLNYIMLVYIKIELYVHEIMDFFEVLIKHLMFMNFGKKEVLELC